MSLNPFRAPLFLLLLALAAHAGERLSFNQGWTFHKGPAPGAEAVDFDAAAWRKLDLPHDWAIEGPFSDKHNARTGGLPIDGTGWYRKEFTLPPESKGKRVSIEFDGAMYNAHVWLNGTFLGSRPFGYIGFQFDLTPLLDRNGSNVIAVRLQPEDLSSRWYPGAGLYRNVWLDLKAPIHVAHWGTSITTPVIDSESADVQVTNQIHSKLKSPAEITIRTTILDPDGKEVAKDDQAVSLLAFEQLTVTSDLAVPNPKLWDLKTPHLYTMVTSIRRNDREIDRQSTRFGIRNIDYKPDEGFFLNGRHVRMQGVCMHHDLGALGAAVSRRATQRQLEIMMEMGVNAIRTAHNPPSPELLDLCDEMGLLVQVEAFDCWELPKVENGYNKFFEAWHERDLRDMIRRDRNHPSVIMWSIGNEILEQNQKDGWKLARRLHRICKDEDPTRLTSAGFNYYPGSVTNGLAAEVDVPGFNYKPADYAEIIANHPDWNVLGSETSSCVSSRGVYHLPIEAYKKHPSMQVTSYDLIGPKWAYPPDLEFHFLEKSPNVIGEFVWTGFDYLGEPTPYGGRDNNTHGHWNLDWPARSSYFGTVDLCGFPKDRYYLYQSQWTDVKDKPMVHLLPHWNWSDRQGESIPVYVYTNAPEAELFLNGKSLGRKTKGKDTTPIITDFNGWAGGDFDSPYRLRWDVPFEAGELKAVALRDGKSVAEKSQHTAGEASRIELEADRSVINSDGDDLAFITVRVLDKDGTLCPNADNRIKFSIEGPAHIAAVDNGDATSLESFQADHRKAFSGMALVVIRGETGKSGTIKLKASGKGLHGSSETIELKQP